MKSFLRNALHVALAASALVACSSPNKPIAEKGAPSEVSAAEMALLNKHDSIMAQNPQLYELKSKLSGYHTEAAAPYIHGLLAAKGAMMGWMHQYQASDSTATPAARLAYFRQQHRILTQVQQQYRATLDSAVRFTTQHPPAGEVQPAPSK